MNLKEGELEWLSNHLGHTIDVHKTSYRLQESTVELAKVSKILLAVDQGKMKSLHGKSLEDISLDGKIYWPVSGVKVTKLPWVVARHPSVHPSVRLSVVTRLHGSLQKWDRKHGCLVRPDFFFRILGYRSEAKNCSVTFFLFARNTHLWQSLCPL